MDEKSNVTTIINNQVIFMTLEMILWTYKGIQRSLPVLLEGLNLPGGEIKSFITRNDSHGMVLGRDNVAENQ